MIITPGHPDFYINKKNYHELEVELAPCRVEGRYLLQRIKPGFGVIQELEFPNLFTNIGMNSLGANNLTFSAVHLGTGTATPSVTDTALQAFGVGFDSSPTSSGANSGSPNFMVRRTYSWTSAIGGATGTWTEVGVSNGKTSGNLRSRALILDGSGNPTSFPVLNDEQARVFYMFDVYPALVDDTRAIDVSGVSYNTITRGIDISNYHSNSLPISPSNTSPYLSVYSGNIVANNSASLSGWLATLSSHTSDAYVNGNFYRDWSLPIPAGTATGTVRTLEVPGYNFGINTGIQIQYDKAVGGGGIVKGATQQLVLNFRKSWARR